jgi:hypothetical protein
MFKVQQIFRQVLHVWLVQVLSVGFCGSGTWTHYVASLFDLRIQFRYATILLLKEEEK